MTTEPTENYTSVLLYDRNCPADIMEEFELREDNECGATLRIKITRDEISLESITVQDPTGNKDTFYQLGWNDPKAFRNYSNKMDWTEGGYGWAMFRVGPFYVLVSGFTA